MSVFFRLFLPPAISKTIDACNSLSPTLFNGIIEGKKQEN